MKSLIALLLVSSVVIAEPHNETITQPDRVQYTGEIVVPTSCFKNDIRRIDVRCVDKHLHKQN